MKIKELGKNLALMAASGLFVLILVEIGLRLFVDNIPHWRPIDSDLGWRLRANLKGWQVQEGRVWIETNSHGFNYPEIPIAKPDDTFRIAILGDSFMEALQVPLEDTFSMLLNDELGASEIIPGKRIEVINFGVGGYNTAQEFLLLKNTVMEFSPDAVVLALFFGNDVTDNHPEMCEGCDRPFILAEEEGIVLDTSFATTPFFEFKMSPTGQVLTWARNTSRILQQVDQARRVYNARKAEGARLMRQTGEIFEIYKRNAEPRFEQAWRNTAAGLELIDQFADEHNIPLLVLTLPLKEQVTLDRELYQEALESSGEPSLFAPEQRINELGQHLGFEVFNLGPPMQEIAWQENIWVLGTGNYLGDGHWNEQGHKIAAQLTAPVLKEFVANLNK